MVVIAASSVHAGGTAVRAVVGGAGGAKALIGTVTVVVAVPRGRFPPR